MTSIFPVFFHLSVFVTLVYFVVTRSMSKDLSTHLLSYHVLDVFSSPSIVSSVVAFSPDFTFHDN